MKYKIQVEIEPDVQLDPANTLDVIVQAFKHLPLGYRFAIEEFSVAPESANELELVEEPADSLTPVQDEGRSR